MDSLTPDATTIRGLRTNLGVTQEQMAYAMAMPLRTLEDIETGRSGGRGVHLRAAQIAAMELAVQLRKPEALPDYLLKLASDLAELNR